jgi:hypothetical protein
MQRIRLTTPQLTLLHRLAPGHQEVVRPRQERTAYSLHQLGLIENHARVMKITDRGVSFLTKHITGVEDVATRKVRETNERLADPEYSALLAHAHVSDDGGKTIAQLAVAPTVTSAQLAEDNEPRPSGRAILASPYPGVDWDILRAQKLWLLSQTGPEAEGLVSMLDDIQDSAVESGEANEIEVFGGDCPKCGTYLRLDGRCGQVRCTEYVAPAPETETRRSADHPLQAAYNAVTAWAGENRPAGGWPMAKLEEFDRYQRIIRTLAEATGHTFE